jgi:uncharacterized protein (TIGR02246 family)
MRGRALGAADEGGAEAAAVRRLQQDIIAAFNTQDLDRLMSYHHPDAMYLVPSQPVIAGAEAIRAMFETGFRANRDPKATPSLEVRTLEVVVCGDWAWARGEGAVTITRPDGPTRGNRKHLSIYKKHNGTWLRYRQMRNGDTPEANR